MRKIPRGVYYLPLSTILKTTLTYPFRDLSKRSKVSEFEIGAAKEFHSAYALAMPHARISLYYILKSYDLPSGSEVLMSPTTLPDMVNMVLLAGLKPVFIDFKMYSHWADMQDAETKITAKTRILYLTHLYGIIPELHSIKDFCKKNKLFFIQDCTQSYNCLYDEKNLNDFADATFFSTCSLKDLHTHMGALIVTNSESQYKNIKTQTEATFKPLKKSYFWKFLKEDLVASLSLNPALFGTFIYPVFKIIFKKDPALLEDLIDGRGLKIGRIIILKGLFAGSGDLRRTEIPEEMLYHFNDLQAEIGLVRLSEMKKLADKRRSNSLKLIQALSENAKKSLPPVDERAHNSFWRLPVFIEDTARFEQHLFARGIDPGKTTLPTLPEMKLFSDLNQKAPVASKMGKHSVFLPNFHYLSDKEIKHIADTINEYFVN